MARIKFPGTKESRSSPEKEKKLNMFGRRRKGQSAEKQKRSAIKPVFISLRRYREIFGDSDEEVLRSLPCTFQRFVYHVLSPRSCRFRSYNLIFICCRKKNFMAFERRSWASRRTVPFQLKIIWMAAKESAIEKMAFVKMPIRDIQSFQSASRQNYFKNLLSENGTRRKRKASS